MTVATFPLAAGSAGERITLATETGTPARPHVGAPGSDSQLGYCLTAPLTWTGRGDFAAAGGVDLVRTVIRAIIGTRCSNPGGDSPGELAWRPTAGSLVDQLRHENVDDPATHALARIYVAEAVQRWDSRIVVKRAGCVRFEVPGLGSGLKTSVVYDVKASGARGAATLVTEDRLDHTVSA